MHNMPCSRDLRNLDTRGPKAVVTIGKSHPMKLHLTNVSAINTTNQVESPTSIIGYCIVSCTVLYTARGKASIMDARPEVSMRFSYLVLTNQNQSLLGTCSYTKRQFCTCPMMYLALHNQYCMYAPRTCGLSNV